MKARKGLYVSRFNTVTSLHPLTNYTSWSGSSKRVAEAGVEGVMHCYMVKVG